MMDGSSPQSAHSIVRNGRADEAKATLLPQPPELHVAGLLAQARNEVARREAAVFAPLPPPPGEANRPPIDWAHLAAVVEEAAEFADAGTTPPDLNGCGRVTRFLGRMASRVFFALARVITRRQQRFNHQTLHALRHLGSLIRCIEEADRVALAAQHGVLGQHQHVLQRHQTVFQRQEATQQVLETTLQRLQTAVRAHQEVLQEQQGLLREYRHRIEEQETRLAELERQARVTDGTIGDACAGALSALPC